jgi:hypothetical protein
MRTLEEGRSDPGPPRVEGTTRRETAIQP